MNFCIKSFLKELITLVIYSIFVVIFLYHQNLAFAQDGNEQQNIFHKESISQESINTISQEAFIGIFSQEASIIPDTTPENFDLVKRVSMPLNTKITSNSIYVTGINTQTPIDVTWGYYRVNYGAWTSNPGVVNNGDTIQLQILSSNEYAKDVSSTVSIGGISDIFSVTTRSRPAKSSSSYVRNCTEQQVVCQLKPGSDTIYIWQKKPGVSCRGGDVGVICEIPQNNSSNEYTQEYDETIQEPEISDTLAVEEIYFPSIREMNATIDLRSSKREEAFLIFGKKYESLDDSFTRILYAGDFVGELQQQLRETYKEYKDFLESETGIYSSLEKEQQHKILTNYYEKLENISKSLESIGTIAQKNISETQSMYYIQYNSPEMSRIQSYMYEKFPVSGSIEHQQNIEKLLFIIYILKENIIEEAQELIEIKITGKKIYLDIKKNLER